MRVRWRWAIVPASRRSGQSALRLISKHRIMKKRHYRQALALVGTLLVASVNNAAWADQTPPADWHVSAKPYVWSLGTNGTVGLG